jgi:hypothetical protein
MRRRISDVEAESGFKPGNIGNSQSGSAVDPDGWLDAVQISKKIARCPRRRERLAKSFARFPLRRPISFVAYISRSFFGSTHTWLLLRRRWARSAHLRVAPSIRGAPLAIPILLKNSLGRFRVKPLATQASPVIKPKRGDSKWKRSGDLLQARCFSIKSNQITGWKSRRLG